MKYFLLLIVLFIALIGDSTCNVPTSEFDDDFDDDSSNDSTTTTTIYINISDLTPGITNTFVDGITKLSELTGSWFRGYTSVTEGYTTVVRPSREPLPSSLWTPGITDREPGITRRSQLPSNWFYGLTTFSPGVTTWVEATGSDFGTDDDFSYDLSSSSANMIQNSIFLTIFSLILYFVF